MSPKNLGMPACGANEHKPTVMSWPVLGVLCVLWERNGSRDCVRPMKWQVVDHF